MKFTATEEQLNEVAALAYNASRPVGMGYIEYVPGDVNGSDLSMNVERGMFLDYARGRMVKLSLFKRGDGIYETPVGEPRADYQSWASRYPTYRALLEAAGIEIEAAA